MAGGRAARRGMREPGGDSLAPRSKNEGGNKRAKRRRPWKLKTKGKRNCVDGKSWERRRVEDLVRVPMLFIIPLITKHVSLTSIPNKIHKVDNNTMVGLRSLTIKYKAIQTGGCKRVLRWPTLSRAFVLNYFKNYIKLLDCEIPCHSRILIKFI